MKKLLLMAAVVTLFCCRQAAAQPASLPSSGKNTLAMLLEGNQRFQHGQSLHPHLTHERIEEIAKSQHPVAVVISCSDSRVPPELVFDQGLGDLFVVRTAGNTLSELELGSVEYAVEHLHVGLIVVMGHEQCGAIKAVVEGSKEEGDLAVLLNHLKEEPEVKALIDKKLTDIDAFVQANVKHVISQLGATPGVLKEKIKSNRLQVVGTEYLLHDGSVKVL